MMKAYKRENVSMNRIQRIEAMERYLDEAREAVDRMQEAMEVYENAQKGYRRLCGYYGSTQWMRDYEADEAGKLPADLKRGVLSEDAVYDLITDNNELTARLLKLLAQAAEHGWF